MRACQHSAKPSTIHQPCQTDEGFPNNLRVADILRGTDTDGSDLSVPQADTKKA
jgi:hypothetical protein